MIPRPWACPECHVLALDYEWTESTQRSEDAEAAMVLRKSRIVVPLMQSSFTGDEAYRCPSCKEWVLDCDLIPLTRGVEE